MGQFIIIPDGKLLVVNGALNRTARYWNSTTTPVGSIYTFGYVVGRPCWIPIYDPNAPAGGRWSNEDLQTSNTASLDHFVCHFVTCCICPHRDQTLINRLSSRDLSGRDTLSPSFNTPLSTQVVSRVRWRSIRHYHTPRLVLRQ